jgi:hypothetical protein
MKQMDTVANYSCALTEMLPLADNLLLDTDMILGGVALFIIFLIILLAVLNLIQFYRRRNLAPMPLEKPKDLDLETTPLPPEQPPPQRLYVLGEPVRLRLVVLAPTGHESDVDFSQVGKLLDKAYPGLAAQYEYDKPLLRVWPAQLSRGGFPPTFFRIAPRGEDEASRWVLVAGQVAIGKRSFLLGLALWADEPCSLGRITVEGHHWLQHFGLHETRAGG